MIMAMLDKQLNEITHDYLKQLHKMTVTYKEEFMALNRSVVLVLTDSNGPHPEDQYELAHIVLGHKAAAASILRSVIAELEGSD